ncbi:MAG: hypothetical protein AAF657_00860 [Acidobacteriota bacterium]
MTHGRAAICLALLTLATLLAMAHYRSPWTRVWGDEGTFLAMMASLTEDGDLRFGEADLARIRRAEGGRTHVILQRDDTGFAYSKPVIYALAGTPFFVLFGETGPIVLNAIAIAIASLFGFAYLRRLGDRGHAALVLVTFLGGALILPYVAWRMTDLLQTALGWIGLVLVFARDRGRLPEPAGALDRLLERSWAPLLGAALLAIVVAMRITNGILVAAAGLAYLLFGRLRQATALASTAAVTYLLIGGLTFSLIGAPNPYRATRSTFTPTTGYPAGDEKTKALERFAAAPASDKTQFDTYGDPRRVAYASLYFFFGRHTGLALYFPAALVFLIFALRHADRISWAALLAFTVGVVFFIVWRTSNYFGGDTFIGNRYLPSIYPLLLIALPRLPGSRWIAAAWLLATISYGSALASVSRHHELDRGSQSHTRAGIFRLAPFDSTAHDIEGRRDRYWAGHFLRFVDRFPGVGKWHIELHSDRPAAEVLMGHWRPLSKIRLFVATQAPEATFEISDRWRKSRYPVGASQAEAGPIGLPVDFEPPSAWRRHRFWWDRKTVYHSHSLRLALSTPDGTPAQATVHYFGDPDLLEQAFSYHLQHAMVPEQATAGSTSKVRLNVRNTGQLTWKPEGVVPVRYEYWIDTANGERVHRSGRLELPRRIEHYEEVDLEFDVLWPEVPGRYRLQTDLVLEHVAWFADRLGAPLSSREVEITAAE